MHIAPQSPIRLIVTDVDGTLVNDKKQIPEDNLRAIRAAQEKGITVAIASGRFPENVYVLLQDYGISCPILGTNGARTVDTNLKVLSEHFMAPQAALAVLRLLLSMEAKFFLFGSRCVCTVNTEHHHSELSQGEKLLHLGCTYTHGPEEALALCRQGVQKFFVFGTIPLDKLCEKLQGIPAIEVTSSGWDNVEIIPQGINKGRGVADLAETLGIPLSQVMALGDQENDIPMLEAVGWGVAMGNACDAAKAAARLVTDTNNQCGFARAIEKYAL